MRAAKRLQTIHVKDEQGRIVSSWQRVRVAVPDGISGFAAAALYGAAPSSADQSGQPGAVRLVASGICLAELLVFSTKRIGIQIHLAQRSAQRELARMRSTACAPHRRVGAPRTTEGLMVVVCSDTGVCPSARPARCVEAYYLD